MRQPPPDRTGGHPAFSLVELLVALAIGAAVITVGVLIFQNFSVGARATGNYVSVSIGTDAMQNFYGINASETDAWVAPNYGRRVHADRLRDLFWSDVERASAVYCLGRTGLNTVHPEAIAVPADFQGRAVDLPNAFRALIDGSSSVFTDYRGACTSTNASVYLLRPSTGVTELAVLAIYDIDLVPTVTPPGTYASVRRYQGDTLTDYYDVFFPTDTSGASTVAFSPLVVAFERAGRAAESTAIDRIKAATGRPFYFVWWPDPAARFLEAASTGTFTATDPRASYPAMGGRTSLFFAVPMFPPL